MKIFIWSSILILIIFSVFSIHYNGIYINQLGFPQLFYKHSLIKGEAAVGSKYQFFTIAFLFDLCSSLLIGLMVSLTYKSIKNSKID
jgi:hypothetical protein